MKKYDIVINYCCSYFGNICFNEVILADALVLKIFRFSDEKSINWNTSSEKDALKISGKEKSSNE